jgi:hypothetical protein
MTVDQLIDVLQTVPLEYRQRAEVTFDVEGTLRERCSAVLEIAQCFDVPGRRVVEVRIKVGRPEDCEYVPGEENETEE